MWRIRTLKEKIENTFNNKEVEVKVREATSDEPWGPTDQDYKELTQICYNYDSFSELMRVLFVRIQNPASTWRNIFKSLLIIERLLKYGSVRVISIVEQNYKYIEFLRRISYVDDDNKNKSEMVHNKAREIIELIQDKERLEAERHAAKIYMNKMEKSHSVQSVTRFDKYEPSRFQNVTSRIINSLTFGVNLKNPDDRFSHYPKNNFQESYSPKFTTSPFKFSPDVEATTKIEPVDEQIKDSPKPPIETIADLIDFPQNIEQSEQNELSFFDPIVSNKNFDNNMDLNYNNVYFDLNIMPNLTSHPVPQSNMDVQNLFQQVNSEYNPINSINIDSFSSIPQSQQSAHNVRSSNNILTDNSEFTSFQFAGNTVINENIEDLLDDNVNKNIMNNQHVVAQADWTSTQTSLKNSQNLDAKNFTNSLI